MRWHTWLFVALLPALALPATLAGTPRGGEKGGKGGPKVTWKKIVVDKAFRSEGVAVADINKDGKPDILIGDVWYEAPDWKMHVIREDRKFDLLRYSETFGCFADDLNGDGWPDLIVIPFPGHPVCWYENPKGKYVDAKGQPGLGMEHVIWPSCGNEAPLYADLFGTGKRVLIMGWQPLRKFVRGPEGRFAVETAENEGQMAWFRPGKDPTQLWEMHPISEPSLPGKPAPGTHRFSHGLGVGDINGDGRLDVMTTAGWWEQPAKDYGRPWKFHPANLGPNCADMFAYDVDGDGKADVISSSAHDFGIWWYQQRPGKTSSPAFVQHTFFKDLMSQTHALHCVDIDGDGLKDLVTGRRWWAHGPKGDPG